jgi:hypothetical protein
LKKRGKESGVYSGHDIVIKEVSIDRIEKDMGSNDI